ncbi:MAG: alpha-mannosidase, partial [Acidimicrobiales bacterium]
MHNDRDLVEKRIERELWERVLPLVHVDRRPLRIEAGPDLDHLAPFDVGSSWGAPWATTWFRLSGEIPPEWAGRRVEAIIDLGFHPRAAGFQCEALVVETMADGSFRPLQGIHPRRTNYAVESVAGPIVLQLEAASNPSFPGYTPSQLGSLDTAGDRLLYRFRRASLVVVDPAAEALAYDIEVLDGVMRTLASSDPRRARLQRTLAETLDRIPDITAAQRVIAPAMAEDFGDAIRHRSVAIGHAHIDTAWLWPLRETVRKVTRTFSSAVGLM